MLASSANTWSTVLTSEIMADSQCCWLTQYTTLRICRSGHSHVHATVINSQFFWKKREWDSPTCFLLTVASYLVCSSVGIVQLAVHQELVQRTQWFHVEVTAN